MDRTPADVADTLLSFCMSAGHLKVSTGRAVHWIWPETSLMRQFSNFITVAVLTTVRE
jgi:hypothetical protein